ncbi:MAG: hypothetical protein ABI036_14710 [Fibrobacteria bacterium]
MGKRAVRRQGTDGSRTASWAAGYGKTAGAAFSAGIMLTVVDQVWGNRTGLFAICLLSLGLAAALAFEFLDLRQALTFPRRLESLFVAGSDYGRRKKSVQAALLASARTLSVFAVIAGTIVMIIPWRHPLGIIAMPALLCLETWAGTGLFWLVAEKEWLSPSRERFSGIGRGSLSKPPKGRLAGSLVRQSQALAHALTAALPAPYAWLARRKLLFLLRLDPVSLALYLLAIVICGIAFLGAGSIFMAGFFASIGCMVTLTLAQTVFTECDRFYRENAFLFPPRRFGFRCDLAMAMVIAAGFGLYFFLAACRLLGAGAALRSQSLWQTWITLAAFAGLVIVDAYASGRTREARTALSFCYLGIAGIMYMFPLYGWIAALAVLAGVTAQCLRTARA